MTKHGKKLLGKCITVNEQGEKIHTKTKHIYDKLNNDIYNGKPIHYLVDGNKQRTRTIFLAQNHMSWTTFLYNKNSIIRTRVLECGKNMKAP